MQRSCRPLHLPGRQQPGARRDRELAFILEDAAARVLVIPDQFRRWDDPTMVRRLRRGLPQLERVIVVRSGQRFEDMLDYARLIDEADPESVEPATVAASGMIRKDLVRKEIRSLVET